MKPTSIHTAHAILEDIEKYDQYICYLCDSCDGSVCESCNTSKLHVIGYHLWDEVVCKSCFIHYSPRCVVCTEISFFTDNENRCEYCTNIEKCIGCDRYNVEHPHNVCSDCYPMVCEDKISKNCLSTVSANPILLKNHDEIIRCENCQEKYLSFFTNAYANSSKAKDEIEKKKWYSKDLNFTGNNTASSERYHCKRCMVSKFLSEFETPSVCKSCFSIGYRECENILYQDANNLNKYDTCRNIYRVQYTTDSCENCNDSLFECKHCEYTFYKDFESKEIGVCEVCYSQNKDFSKLVCRVCDEKVAEDERSYTCTSCFFDYLSKGKCYNCKKENRILDTYGRCEECKDMFQSIGTYLCPDCEFRYVKNEYEICEMCEILDHN